MGLFIYTKKSCTLIKTTHMHYSTKSPLKEGCIGGIRGGNIRKALRNKILFWYSSQKIFNVRVWRRENE